MNHESAGLEAQIRLLCEARGKNGTLRQDMRTIPDFIFRVITLHRLGKPYVIQVSFMQVNQCVISPEPKSRFLIKGMETRTGNRALGILTLLVRDKCLIRLVGFGLKWLSSELTLGSSLVCGRDREL